MYDWSLFDDIICISCKDSVERREICDKIFKKYKIPARYSIVERHSNGINEGCFESHINIFKECYEKGKKNVLVFEDDIVTSEFLTPENLNICNDFMKNNRWDLFYLGAVPDIRTYNQMDKREKGIYKIRSICTHAYAANENIIKKYKDLKYKGIPIDYMFRDQETEAYSLFPTLFYQNTGLIKYFSQDAINEYFKLLEWYAYNFNFQLRYIIIIILMLILLFIIIILIFRKIKK